MERSVGFFKHSYWAGVSFTDLDDLNRQAHAWCERANLRVHHTTHERPRERREQEELAPLPAAFAWERFATEERKVSWDGYLSYDGVLYGLPSSPPVAGSVVQVREWHWTLKVWHADQLLVELAKRRQSQAHVEHPDQWRSIPPDATLFTCSHSTIICRAFLSRSHGLARQFTLPRRAVNLTPNLTP